MKTFLVACLALLAGFSGARAEEWLYFYPIRGELSVGFEGRWTKRNADETTRSTEYEERLNLNLNGYSLDPRIFTFNINLEPTLEQEKSDLATGTSTADSTTLNYAVQLRALHGVPASPISLGANFSSNSSETDGSLGSRSDVTAESRSASLDWKLRPFRSTLTVREQSLEEIFIPAFGLPPSERDQFQRTLTYRGKSSKMELLLETNEVDDRTVRDQDYDSRLARLNNNFRWGKGSSLTSRMEYFDREGFNAEERASVNESLRLQHTNNLYTTYEYGYNSLRRTTDTETHRGSFGVNHRLYTNLDTNLSLTGSTTRSEDFEQDIYTANLDFRYHKQFTPDLRVSANLGGGYRVSDSVSGRLDFTETKTVPQTLIVVLTQRFIIRSTIVVTATACSPCTEGSDYIVEDAGGDFTQLSIIPIPSGGRLQDGDVITIDYAFEPPTAEFYGIPYRVGVRVDYRSFAFFHRTTGENQTFVSGPDPTIVGDRRFDTTGVEWNWRRGRDNASIGAKRVFTENIGRSTTEYFLDQSLTYAIAPAATLNASLSESFLRDGTAADAYRGDLSVKWYVYPGTSVTPRLSVFRRDLDPGSTDSFVEAGVDVRWIWRRLSANLSYDHTETEDDAITRIEDRVFLNLTRKF